MAKPPSSRAGIARAGQARAGYINSDEKVAANNPPPRGSEPMSELPPLPQGNSFDVAAQVVKDNADQERRRTALIGSMGINTSVLNQGPISSGPIGAGPISGGQLNPEGAIYRDTSAIVSPVDEVAALLQKLRGFQSGLQTWITELRASTRNGPEDHAKDLSLIAFLENLAKGLAEVADDVEQAISQGRNGAAEPILLGKAAIAARAVSETALKWLEEQGTKVIDVPAKLGLFGSALIVLSHFGLSGDAITGAVAGFVLGAAIKK